MSAPVAKKPSTSSAGLEELTTRSIRLEELYDAGTVKRFHCHPAGVQQTIAEHVYGSLLVATELVGMNRKRAAEEGLSISLEKIYGALLIHDAPELETGDIPAPTKRASEQLRCAIAGMEANFYDRLQIKVPDLNRVEEDIVHASDTLDLIFTTLRAREHGNRHPKLERILENAFDYLEELRHLAGIDEFAYYLSERWGKV
jgi:5'-deoxynucleotidase YfbR-like HD superfamily hydrolase